MLLLVYRPAGLWRETLTPASQPWQCMQAELPNACACRTVLVWPSVSAVRMSLPACKVITCRVVVEKPAACN